MMLIVMLLLYTVQQAAVVLLTDLCLRRWKRTADKARDLRKYWLIPYVALALLPPVGTLLPESSVKYALQAAGNVFLGFDLYYGGLLASLLALGLLARLIARGRLGSGRYGAALCLSLCVALAVFGCGLVHAQQTRVVSYDLSLDKPAADGEAMTIALIGDLHLGLNSRLATTEKMVELINQEKPDVVLIAGDIFTSCYKGLAHPERYAEALSGIEAKYGVYAVYGNHDVEEPLLGGFPVAPLSSAFRSPEMEAFCDASGFITLEDETVTLPNGVQVIGRIDRDKAGDGTADRMAVEALLAGADRAAPILVLEHEPVDFQTLAEAGADAALCGHTHAGQVFPGNLIVPLFNENDWGHKVLYGMDTFVTAGVGYYGPPLRVGTDSEVTVIHLTFEQQGDH